MTRWAPALAIVPWVLSPLWAALPLSEVVDRLEQSQQSIQDISFDYTQRANGAGGDSSQSPSGSVRVKQSPRWIRVDQKSPQESTLVTNGTRVWFYIPAAKQQLTGDFHEWGAFSHMPQDLIDLTGNFRKEVWQKDYNVYFDGYDNHLYALRFKPISVRAKPDIAAMRLWIQEDTFLPARWELSTPQGPITMDLTHVQVNQGLDDSVFDHHVPPGTAEVPITF